MRRWYHGFPAGRAGSGLLVLRAGLGFQLLATGWAWLEPVLRAAPLSGAIVGILSLLCGAASLLGFATPLAQVLVAVIQISTLSAVFAPVMSPSLMSGDAVAVLTLAISIALAMLGPGAYSIDAYLFGRREIHIPRIASKQ